ncbi:MAG: hypothetical protein JJU10_11160 [Idiomarina sp.]|nr:hypothetical protein [Idiomarina sp.]
MTERKDEVALLTSDFSESAKRFLMNKIKDPRPFYFVSAWLAVNWVLVYFLARTNLPPLEAINVAKSESMLAPTKLIFYPIVFYFILLTFVPIFIAAGKWLYNRVHLRISSYMLEKIEPHSFVSREEFKQLEREKDDLEERYLTGSEIEEKNSEIESLKNNIKKLESTLNSLQNKAAQFPIELLDFIAKLRLKDMPLKDVLKIIIPLQFFAESNDAFDLNSVNLTRKAKESVGAVMDELVKGNYLTTSKEGVLLPNEVNSSWAEKRYKFTPEGRALFKRI